MTFRAVVGAAAVLAAVWFWCAPASAYVLDAGTGPFTNPPVGGYRAQVPVTGSAATGNPLIVELVEAAVRYWEGYPASCQPGIAVNLSSDDPDADPEDRVTNGYVYDNDLCVMYLNVLNSQWPITARNAFHWCPVITHEMGHMLGLDHSPNPLNIMTSSWIPQANPECNVFPHRGYRDAKPSARLRDPFYNRRGKRIPPSRRKPASAPAPALPAAAQLR